MKNYAPTRCPVCGETRMWRYAGNQNGGFSKGKAVAGAVAFGPIGLAAGALGKKKALFYCGKCGFSSTYDL